MNTLTKIEAMKVLETLKKHKVDALVTRVGEDAFLVKADTRDDLPVTHNSDEDLGHETVMPEDKSEGTEDQLKEQKEIQVEGRVLSKEKAERKLARLQRKGIAAEVERVSEDGFIVKAMEDAQEESADEDMIEEMEGIRLEEDEAQAEGHEEEMAEEHDEMEAEDELYTKQEANDVLRELEAEGIYATLRPVGTHFKIELSEEDAEKLD